MRQLFVVGMMILALATPGLAADLAEIETQYGTIVLELYPEEAPATVANFKKLADKGFYDGLTFHRVVPGFVVQGGDPDGTGQGGPGYTVKAEISKNLSHQTGSVATARLSDQVNPSRASSGSQFYICLGPQPHLDGGYTIFGQVIKGMDYVRQIRRGDVMKRVTVLPTP